MLALKFVIEPFNVALLLLMYDAFPVTTEGRPGIGEYVADEVLEDGLRALIELMRGGGELFPLKNLGGLAGNDVVRRTQDRANRMKGLAWKFFMGGPLFLICRD